MTIEQLQKIKMNLAVDKYTDELSAEIKDRIPHFNKTNADFKIANLEILKHLEIQQRKSTGFRADKVTTRNQLMQITLETASMLKANANYSKDIMTYTVVSYSKRYLQNSNEIMCHVNCKRIFDLAKKEFSVLQSYGFTQDLLSQFELLLSRFHLALPAPKAGINKKAAATDAIKSGLKQTDLILQTLDGLVSTIQFREPLIYDSYFASRKLTQPSYKLLSARGTIKSSSGEPLPFARYSCETLNLKKKASKKGTFKLSNIPFGPFEFKFERPGYETVIMIVDFIEGERAEIEVVMNELERLN